MLKRTGAQIIVELLERHGVRFIAGMPGGANLPLYDVLYHSRVMRHVLVRHEQGAGFIAQGMARASGQPGVCFATSGPGATNLITAIADAKLDSIPLVCFTGQVPSSAIGTDAFQEVDTYGLSIPVTKHSYLVRSASDLLRIVPEAFHIAKSGRPGPVLIDVPKDIQLESVRFASWPELGGRAAAPRANPELVDRAADMINGAVRPVFYIGGGIIHAEASRVLIQCAQVSKIPITSTLMGLGAVPADHPQFVGMLGMHAAPYTNRILEECDLLIATGVRFDDRATGKVARFCPQAKIVHIDIDPSEIGKIKQAHVGITADVRETLAQLLPRLHKADRAEWRRRVSELRERHPLKLNDEENPCSSYGLIHEVGKLPDGEACVTTDVGQHQMRVAQIFPFTRPRQWLTSGGLGTMGFGVPAALGAWLARPKSTVVCFSGDGSLLINLQELATVVEEGARVKIFVFNNQGLGLVHQQQELFYGQRVMACRYGAETDFVKVARAFGMPVYRLTEVSEPGSFLETVMKEPGPCLIDVPLEANVHVYPMVAPGAANIDMIEGPAELVAEGLPDEFGPSPLISTKTR